MGGRARGAAGEGVEVGAGGVGEHAGAGGVVDAGAEEEFAVGGFLQEEGEGFGFDGEGGLQGGAVCLVEWPEKAGDYLAQADMRVALAVEGREGAGETVEIVDDRLHRGDGEGGRQGGENGHGYFRFR